MTQVKINLLKPSTKSEFPSFSIVYETENLSSVELENIYRSLASLKEQDISPESPREFTILDSGYAPEEAIAQIRSEYPWITVKSVPGIGYYEAKMLGATLATGDIVVFCDSDCVYEPNWLKNILASFQQNPEINVMAGETSTPVRNAYELALAMHFFFPRLSGGKHPYISNHYFLNGVAFRRDFLLQNPIPTYLPLYRGNCQIHICYLCNIMGEKIWKHPQARAVHEPVTVDFHIWRYLLLGRDGVIEKYIKSCVTDNKDMMDCTSIRKNLHPLEKIRGICSTILGAKPFKLQQIRQVLREDRRRLLMLPMAIPLVLWFELLYVIGGVITYLQRDWLLQRYTEK